MATAPTTPKVLDSYLERDGVRSYGSYQLNPSAEMLAGLDGEEVLVPSGFNELVVQPRMCGDFYAGLFGVRRSFASTGATRIEAVRGVIARAGQVPA